MRVIKPDSNDFLRKPCGIGLGNFDGLHIGHMTLVDTLIHECQIECISSVVYTFEAHPENILRKKLRNHLITSNEKKIELFNIQGLHAVYFEYFDENFSRIQAKDFIRDVLVNRFGIKLAVVGENYRFGYKGEGDIELLKEYGKKYGFRVRVLPLINIGGEVVSSTNIRKHLEKGNVKRVAEFLGRYFSIKGEVEVGKQLGRKMGFPTANLYPKEWQGVPKTGVYITKTCFNGRYYNSITNMGYDPTFGDSNKFAAETFLFDFDEDMYGQEIEVFFLEYLRGEKKFDSMEDLKKEIALNISMAKNYFVLFREE